MRRATVAGVLDVACVLVFVVIGRASHADGDSLAGIASTSWPFLCGLAAGWAAARAWPGSAGCYAPGQRGQLALWPAGLAAWLGTVALGMVLRVLAGQGTASAFIVVALVFLGATLLGWRLVARRVTRPRRLDPPRPGSGRCLYCRAEGIAPDGKRTEWPAGRLPGVQRGHRAG